LKECGGCRVKNFIGYVGLQETPHDEFEGLMRSDMPVDVEHRNTKYVQKRGHVVK
jgi:hypothetical protein